MNDRTLRVVREQFFDGSLPIPAAQLTASKPRPKTGIDRIDNRLKQVVVKACRNSAPATIILQKFETYLLDAFDKGEEPLKDEWYQDLLKEAPHKQTTASGQTVIRFCFDEKNGGFNRLILHAVAQFHGLVVVSKRLDGHRALLVTGQDISDGEKLKNHIEGTN